MANLQHMMQFDEATDDSVSAASSASEDEEEDDVMSAEVEDDEDENDEDDTAEGSSSNLQEKHEEIPEVPRNQPPKMRIKLSLRLGRDKSPPPPVKEEEEEHVQATVVQSSDEDAEEEEVVRAEPISPTVESKEMPKVEKKRKSDTTKTNESKRTTDTKASKKTKKSSDNSPQPKSESKNHSSHSASTNSRPVRFPSISSPGLFMISPPGISSSTLLQQEKETTQKSQNRSSNSTSSNNNTSFNGYVTPSSVFDFTMASAGYSVSSRTDNPHRGSSMKRTVGDMFDSDVNFTSHFPNLIPKKLLKSCKKVNKKASAEKSDQTNDIKDSISKKPDTNTETSTQSDEHTLPSIFNRVLETSLSKSNSDEIKREESANKITAMKKTIPSFRDMIPISLTIPLPDNYVEKRLKYFDLVDAREKAIVSSQKASDAVQDARESYNDAKEEWEKKMASYQEKRKKIQKHKPPNASDSEAEFEGENKKKDNDAPPMPTPPHIPEPVFVPPIPDPPSPPSLIYSPDNNTFEVKKENENYDDKKKTTKSITDSICIPEEKKHLVQHLDPNCFHYVDGRYFGLSSNNVADPQFVGPNAPGIAGLNFSGGTGLATSYVGNSTSGGNSSLQNNSSITGSAGASSSATGQSSAKKSSGSQSGASGSGKGSGGSDKGGTSKKNTGPTPTATSLELKRIMEKGGDLAEEMRNYIIRAAVYHSKTGGNSGSFVGCNGETYPDVSKAFSLHGNLRPCNRCKSNKQGAYHCRLRRKHKEPDYDGGESASILTPFFEIPLENLIIASRPGRSK